MRVVQASGWYLPERIGATEVYVAALSDRLLAAGHQVIVAAPDATGAGERTYEHAGIPVYRYPHPPAPTRAELHGDVTARSAERFHAWLAQQAPDVLHVHTLLPGLGVPELQIARSLGARVVVTSHSSSLGYLCQRGTMMRWGREACDGFCRVDVCAACELNRQGLPVGVAKLIGRLSPRAGEVAARLPGRIGTALGMSDLIRRNRARQRAMFLALDRFVLLTHWAYDAVVASGAPREKLVLNALGIPKRRAECGTRNVRTWKPDGATRPPVRIGYLGRFHPIMGVHYLARAFASLSPDVPLTLEFRGPVCSAAERRVVGELQALIGTDPRVSFEPEVAPEHAAGVLASYDVLCVPAVHLEGGPTVALEAYAVQTPVVGARIDGLAELVTPGLDGQLVPPGDWRALAAALHTIADEPGIVDRWRDHLPPPRTMDDVARDYVALYAEICAGGAAALSTSSCIRVQVPRARAS
jgi:glycosyltransferase involved in cell wall biosynthesis